MRIYHYKLLEYLPMHIIKELFYSIFRSYDNEFHKFDIYKRYKYNVSKEYNAMLLAMYYYRTRGETIYMDFYKVFNEHTPAYLDLNLHYLKYIKRIDLFRHFNIIDEGYYSEAEELKYLEMHKPKRIPVGCMIIWNHLHNAFVVEEHENTVAIEFQDGMNIEYITLYKNDIPQSNIIYNKKL